MIKLYQEFSQDLSTHSVFLIDEDLNRKYEIPQLQRMFLCNAINEIAKGLESIQK